MLTAGWIIIILEITLLLVWIYSIFLKKNGTDPAGKGIAIVFLLGLIFYVIAGIVLMLVGRGWSIILVFLMGLLPLGFVIMGLWKQYGPSGEKQRY